ncbi:MAG TPA: hypothetical protein VD993_11040 [Chitinophagaceae bacterium]|nr:hypothetical protein [Chitinophagaceae bacterium]
MATSPTKLTLMSFPQHWNGSVMKLNILALPHEDPLAPFAVDVPPGVTAPSFATAQPVFSIKIIGSMDMMPTPLDVTHSVTINVTPPAERVSLFEALRDKFNITKPSNVINPARADTFIQKYLPVSYRNSFAFSQPRTPYARIDDSYHCEMKKKRAVPPPVYSTDEVSWGKVFALALRQPVLARKLGFVYEVEVNVPAGAYDEGGWIYVDLDATSDYHTQVIARPEIVKRYAARIPALTGERSLFAAVQFPVSDVLPAGNYDPVFAEAEEYDDGFAKIVHAMQPVSANLLVEPGNAEKELPPTRDFGIRLGWDDEQLLIWQNRQMTLDPDTGQRLDAPMGIFNHRIDVRKHGESDAEWNSLVKVRGDLQLNGIALGHFDGELGIEVGPVQQDGQKQGIFWLPAYYTQWTGTSLIIKDEKAAKLSGTDGLVNKQMTPVDAERKPLLYGERYDFRVRFADTTGGGPGESNVPINGGQAPVSTTRFKRYLPPHLVRVNEIRADETDDSTPPESYEIFRPLLGYPSLLYTGLPNAYAKLLADRPQAIIENREPAYADPDVTQVQIDVAVRALEMDQSASRSGQESYYHLFTTVRDFPADETASINLQAEFHDAAVIKFGDASDLGDLPLTTSDSPLRLPTSRMIRIQVRPVCKPDPTLAYFGSQLTRIGKPVTLYTRSEAKDERNLFVNEPAGKQFRAILLQPDPLPSLNLTNIMTLSGHRSETPANLFQRLAEELQLDNAGMSVFGKPGQRVVFGCSKGIPHTLSPEHASITFASKADLVHQWIPTISLHIQRDWSWDGLEAVSFEIKRNGIESVGTIELKNTLGITAATDPERSATRIIFFDAVNPQKFSGTFPQPMELFYTIEPIFKTAPDQKDAIKELRLTVPVAVPPAQVPRIVSAGLALSPYEHTEDYSSTNERQRMLWIEFAEPLQNPDDDYFAFVKAYAPDPILIPGQTPVGDPEDSQPYLPPELIRVIIPGQSDDQAGLNAWQKLIPCNDTSPRHFMVPLPPGLNADSAELFGFFVYEFCVGHARVWSTAQGRYGRPMRLTGVQHPAPQLQCMVDRTEESIKLSAPYATPVYNGRTLEQHTPQTEIWGVLYTQVLQADGQAFRNILLGERKMRRMERNAFLKGKAIERYGICSWQQDEVIAMLRQLGLPGDSPLSVLAVELYKNYAPVARPLSDDLGKMRIYRTSPLKQVPFMCCC